MSITILWGIVCGMYIMIARSYVLVRKLENLGEKLNKIDNNDLN